ncbi:MAG: cytochrome c3 family protein [Thermodesulfovibrionales bacterium]|nr:cytochrome c3 family protein [Thermodesulfovibrionales bacterium]
MSKPRIQFHILTLVILTFALFTIGVFSLAPPVSAEENPCLTCHAKIKEPQFVHAAVALGCQTCHKTVEGKSHPAEKQSIVLIQNLPGVCFTCHTQSKFQEKTVHSPVLSGTCTGCHDPHSSNVKKLLTNKMPGLCFNCHKESAFKGKYDHAPVYGGMCPACHSPHSSPNQKLLVSPSPEVCYTCHEKSKFNKKYVHAVVKLGCDSCHDPHKGDYINLLLKQPVELCLSCHPNKNDGRHIVNVPTEKIHPISGVKDPSVAWTKKIPDPDRPGYEIEVPDPDKPGQELTCFSCHDPHSSDYRKLFPVKNICKKCHVYY